MEVSPSAAAAASHCAHALTLQFDQEAAEVRQKLNGFELTPELWLLKLLLGGIDV